MNTATDVLKTCHELIQSLNNDIFLGWTDEIAELIEIENVWGPLPVS